MNILTKPDSDVSDKPPVVKNGPTLGLPFTYLNTKHIIN